MFTNLHDEIFMDLDCLINNTKGGDLIGRYYQIPISSIVQKGKTFIPGQQSILSQAA